MYAPLFRLSMMVGLRLPPAADMAGLRVCILYGVTSIIISLIFKLLLSGFGYSGTFSMLATQLAMSLLFCAAAKKWGQHIPSLHVPDVKLETLQKTNAAFTLLAEAWLLGKYQPSNVNLSVMVIVLGAVVAGLPSLQADWLGFVYTLGNNVFTASSMSLTKKFSEETGIKGLGIVLYNAIVALPLCLIGVIATGELEYTFGADSEFKHGYDPQFYMALLTASAIGVFMSYIVFLCTTVNSPLATSITGNLKDIASTVIAAVLFRDFVPTLYNMLGLLLSFTGAAWFSWAKISQSRVAADIHKTSQDEKVERQVFVDHHEDKAVIEILPRAEHAGPLHRYHVDKV